MHRDQTLCARQKLVGGVPITGELLRGSLLERTVRHSSATVVEKLATEDMSALAAYAASLTP